MSNETFEEKQEKQLSIHIFDSSSVMIGVCLTVIGILSISHYQGVEIIGDNITVFVAMLSLISCISSYAAIRTKKKKRRLLWKELRILFFLAPYLEWF